MRFLIVSGPTREPLDPVRYLSNYSTGTMGKYLAYAAKAKRHQVDWVRCPEDAETAADLLKLLRGRLRRKDVLIMAAAVCDARPASYSAKKIKKKALSTIRLVKNPDILAELSKIKKKGQVFIGFALESVDLIRNAAGKRTRKGLELIVVQKVTANERPFGEKVIDAYLLDKAGDVLALKKISKQKLAQVLVAEAVSLRRQQSA